MYKLLSAIYPQIKWNKNSLLEANIWNNENLANYFVSWLKQQKQTEITRARLAVKNLATETNYLVQQLSNAFPHLSWLMATSSQSKKTQYKLKECIEKLLIVQKDAVLLEEYRHPDISNLELDYFLPQYNLAFEYQVM